MTAQKKREWTVFFLVKAANETIAEAIQMIDHLMHIKFPDEVTILLCIHFNKKNIEAVLQRDVALISKDPIVELTTLFCEISTVHLPKGFRNEFKNIIYNSDFDITSEEDLSTYFKEEVLQPFEARRYLMFTWDHGNGFGIFSQPDGMTSIIETMSLQSRILTMDELGNAILWAMGIKKIDILVMMNCHMQVFDTLYALGNNAHYVIAPQSAIPVSGYNYKAIFRKLSKIPGISARRLAAHVMESYGQRIPGAPPGNVSLSACHLKYCNLMTSLLDKLALAIEPRLKDEVTCEELIDAFEDTKIVHGAYNIIDLYSFLDRLRKVATKEEEIWIKYLFLLKERIVYRQYLGDLLKPPPDQIYDTHNGISLLSPVKETAPELRNHKLIRYFTKTSFSGNTKWGQLMTAIREIQE